MLDSADWARVLADTGAVTAIPELTTLRDAVAVLPGRQARSGPERCPAPALGIDAE